jgi:nucleotide-binding universal stress UspA family protein
MFTRLLVGLDGGIHADVALEQAVSLGRRFGATIIVATVREPGAPDPAELLERGRFRVAAGGLQVEAAGRAGDADLILAELARDVDAVFVGRRGSGPAGRLGATAASLVRIAQHPVVVCGAAPSPMRICAVAFDGRDASTRALELAMRYASGTGADLHVVHAATDNAAGQRVIGMAEATLSLQGVSYQTHLVAAPPATAVATVARDVRADALFAGAHIQREQPGRPSPVIVSHAEEILKQTAIPVVVQP